MGSNVITRRGSTRFLRHNTHRFSLIFFLFLLSCLVIVAVWLSLIRIRDEKEKVMTTQQYSDVAQWNLDQHLNDPRRNLFTPTLPIGCTFTVLILRHCEYDIRSDRAGCNYIGRQRAMYLATLFGQTNSSRWPIPTRLYALDDESKPWNLFGSFYGRRSTVRRDIQTLLPLSQTLQQQNSSKSIPYTSNHDIVSINHPTKLAQEIYHHIVSSFTNASICGQLIVVAVSNVLDISRLALELGCGPYNAGCPRYYPTNTTNIYDSIWELTFVYTDSSPISMSDFAPSTPRWSVFGSVIQQYFDPLSFSSQVLGLYDP